MDNDVPAELNPDGRDIIEQQLRQAIFVEHYPDKKAGAALPNVFKAGGHSAYGQKHPSFSETNPYSPFVSELEHKLVQWIKVRGPGATAVTELLSIPGLRERLGLSFKNSRELNKIIDTKIPIIRPPFKRTQIHVGDEPYLMYYRDIVQCIKTLYGNEEFAQYLVFKPECHYSDESRQVRLYHEMHTGKWWWWTQV